MYIVVRNEVNTSSRGLYIISGNYSVTFTLDFFFTIVSMEALILLSERIVLLVKTQRSLGIVELNSTGDTSFL